eukprot:1600154-Amphidinium_carterae.1
MAEPGATSYSKRAQWEDLVSIWSTAREELDAFLILLRKGLYTSANVLHQGCRLFFHGSRGHSS